MEGTPETSKAILDMLVMLHCEVTVMKEQLAAIISQNDPDVLLKIQQTANERYMQHSLKLRAALYKHYGRLEVNDLLKVSDN